MKVLCNSETRLGRRLFRQFASLGNDFVQDVAKANRVKVFCSIWGFCFWNESEENIIFFILF